VDWETGDQAVRDFATGENRRLTNKGTWLESSEFALFSTMSPDGQQVAYAWFNKDNFYDLRIVGLHGSEPRVLYSNKELPYLQPAAWSPDGKHILANFFRKDRTNQIVMVSVADGSVRVLKTLDWRYPQKMSFSPDGRYIVYDFPPKEDAPERDIFLLATDGSRQIPLVEHPANDLVPVWAPDGKSIVFSSDRTGTMGAWVIQVAAGKPGGSPELVKQDIGRRALPLGFTQKGSFYYGLETGMHDVYLATLDLATGRLLAPPRRASQRFVGSNTSPDWSPDGKYLAYVSQRGRAPFGLGSNIIAIRSVETGEERELSPKITPQRHYGVLRWSPDGRSLLALGRDEKGRQGLYQVDAQTGSVTPLVQIEPGEYLLHAVWALDRRAIFYIRSDFSTKSSLILVHDLETGREKELYRAVVPASIGRGLAVSPDGRQLAFITGDQATRSTALKVMPAAGGETRELLRAQEPEAIAWNAGLAWTPDGREVLFGRERSTSLEDQTVELWRISAEGGEPQKLELAMEQLRGLRFHPDGRRIVFTAGQFKAEVWVLENFLPKPKGQAARLEDE
jgi:Tol biopolymer transport system component